MTDAAPEPRSEEEKQLISANLVRHLDEDADKMENIAEDAERAWSRGAMPRLQHLLDKGSAAIKKANLRGVHAGLELGDIPDAAIGAMIRCHDAWTRILTAGQADATLIAKVQARHDELTGILAGLPLTVTILVG